MYNPILYVEAVHSKADQLLTVSQNMVESYICEVLSYQEGSFPLQLILTCLFQPTAAVSFCRMCKYMVQTGEHVTILAST